MTPACRAENFRSFVPATARASVWGKGRQSPTVRARAWMYDASQLVALPGCISIEECRAVG